MKSERVEDLPLTNRRRMTDWATRDDWFFNDLGLGSSAIRFSGFLDRSSDFSEIEKFGQRLRIKRSEMKMREWEIRLSEMRMRDERWE